MKSESIEEDEFEASWRGLSDFCARTDQSDKSSMWSVMSADFMIREYPKNGSVKKLLLPYGRRGYNLYSSSHESLRLKTARGLLRFFYLFYRALRRCEHWFLQKISIGCGVDNYSYYPFAIKKSRQLDNHKSYLDFCEKHSVSPHSTPAIKSFYVASRIANILVSHTRCRVFEIGGGLGTLAVMLYHKCNIRQYVIVDLPEMILNAALFVRSFLHDVPVKIISPGSVAKYDPDFEGVYFVETTCTSQLGDNFFDFALNIDSFQEMTEAQVSRYIDLIQKVVSAGGYFMNLNRRKYLDIEGFDNNPLLYPYHIKNEVLVWETDRTMEAIYNSDNSRPDGWIMRLEKVSKGLAEDFEESS